MHIFTLGCKVNQAESEAIARSLSCYDVIVINTCTVTARADAKCRQLIRRVQKEYPAHTIVVTGCYVERAYNELSREFPSLILLRNSEKTHIAEHLKHMPRAAASRYHSSRTRAFVKIQDGCNGTCTYCIVPYVRSTLWNKPFADVCMEIKKLIASGYNEIVLTGVRIGMYTWTDEHGTTRNFSDALQRLCETNIFTTQRLRISSIEPTEITDECIDVMATHRYISSGNGVICPHLHIPLQSGDDTILRRMNRGYDTQFIRERIARLRAAVPDCAITADIIVGFPGETDAEFENTCAFLETVGMSGLHIFPFSPRKGTLAYEMHRETPVQPTVVAQRKHHLKILDTRFRERTAQQLENSVVEILVEHKRQGGMCYGFTPHYIKACVPYIKGIENTFVQACITEIQSSKQVVCDGRIVSSS